MGHVAELKRCIADLGRLRSIRDPLSELDTSLTAPQVHCIMWLGVDGALSASVLAQRIGCALPNLTGVVDRLEKLGFVERSRDENDRRVVRVGLTSAGRGVFHRVDAGFSEGLGLFLSAMNEADRKSLLAILGRAVGALHDHLAKLRGARDG